MDTKRGLMLVLFTAIISGVSIFLNSFAIKGFDSTIFTFSKNVIVAVFLTAIILTFGNFHEIKSLKKKQWLKLSLIGLLGGSIPFIMFFKGLQMTTGTTSGFLQKTIFIFVAILSLIFLKDKFEKKIIVSACLILAGTFLIAKPDFTFSTGHLLVLGAVVFWAIENLISKNALEDMSGNIVAWGRMFFGSIFIFIYIAFVGNTTQIFSMNSAQYLWILITAALLLGYVITYYNGLKHLNPTTATSILAFGAPITYILTALFGGTLNPSDIYGTVCITIGVGIIFFYDILIAHVSKILNTVN